MKSLVENALFLRSDEGDWDESKHPRGENGQFGEGTGAGSVHETVRHLNEAHEASGAKKAIITMNAIRDENGRHEAVDVHLMKQGIRSSIRLTGPIDKEGAAKTIKQLHEKIKIEKAERAEHERNYGNRSGPKGLGVSPVSSSAGITFGGGGRGPGDTNPMPSFGKKP